MAATATTVLQAITAWPWLLEMAQIAKQKGASRSHTMLLQVRVRHHLAMDLLRRCRCRVAWVAAGDGGSHCRYLFARYGETSLSSISIPPRSQLLFLMRFRRRIWRCHLRTATGHGSPVVARTVTEEEGKGCLCVRCLWLQVRCRWCSPVVIASAREKRGIVCFREKRKASDGRWVAVSGQPPWLRYLVVCEKEERATTPCVCLSWHESSDPFFNPFGPILKN